MRDAILRADDARVQTAEQRHVIDAALATGAPEVRVAALRAIGRTRRAEFLPAAIAALANPSLDVRREAAFAVGHIGSGAPEAFAPAERALREALGRESDMLVCAALAEEYGRLPFPTVADVDAAARTLRALLTRLGRAGDVAAFIELGVARGAEALARRAVRIKADAAGVAGLLQHFYTRQRVASDPRQDVLRARIRRLAVSGLLTLNRLTPDLVDLALTDPDEQVRRLGVISFQAREPVGPAVPARPIGWLADSSMIVRHAVASRIGPKLPEVAEAAMADKHLNVRLAALDALGQAGVCRAPCVSRLERADAFGAAWHEGAHALVALARTDAAAAQSHVARAAGANTWQVRMYAARAALHTRQADVIARLATDDNVNVRHAALVSWRGAQLPGLTTAAVAALVSDDGQLVLEAATALGMESREPGTGNRQPGEPETGNRESRTVERRPEGGQAGVAAGQPPVAAGLVPRTEIVAALRSTLARLTALKRETSRDPRVALIERLAELDPDRATTLRPYLSDFDPFVAARVAALLRARGIEAGSPLGAPKPPGDLSAEASAKAEGGTPTWAEVERLAATTVTLRFSGGRSLSLRLYAENAPTAVARFVTQVRAGQWNGRTFHRVEPGFVVQGGSPAANEYAGAADFARDEFSALSHVRGTVGISTRGPDTGDGQIFINLVDNARLDFAYTVIGSIAGDPSLIDDIVEGEVIESATVMEQVAAGVGVGLCPTPMAAP